MKNKASPPKTKYKVRRMLKKDEIVTIPNFLSLIRLLMIPLIIWLYCFCHKNALAVLVVVLSGITDIVDGWIARHFDMVTDLGKVLDPIADKLTQGTVILCLTTRYPLMFLLIGIFTVTEILKLLFGLMVFRRKDAVNSARWYGKLNTVLLYFALMLLMLYSDPPVILSSGIILLCCAMNVVCVILYIVFYLKLLSVKGEQNRTL